MNWGEKINSQFPDHGQHSLRWEDIPRECRKRDKKTQDEREKASMLAIKEALKLMRVDYMSDESDGYSDNFSDSSIDDTPYGNNKRKKQE